MELQQLSSQFTVKKLDENNAQEILDLCLTNPIYYYHCPPVASLKTVKEDLNALPPNTTYQQKFFLGYYQNQELVAVMDLILGYPNAETAFVGFFMVKASFQKQGIGNQIQQDLEKHLLTIGYNQIRLAWAKTNNQAKSFWQARGFEKILETKTTNDVEVEVGTKQLKSTL